MEVRWCTNPPVGQVVSNVMEVRWCANPPVSNVMEVRWCTNTPIGQVVSNVMEVRWCVNPLVSSSWVVTGLIITVGHRPKSDHFWLIVGHLCLWSDIMSYQLVSNKH